MAKPTVERGKSKIVYPEFNLLDYNHSLLLNLNWYNLESDTKQKKDWTLEYWKKEQKSIAGLRRLPDGYFTTVGAVAHMIGERNIALDVNHLTYLDKKYVEFMTQAKLIIDETEEKS